MTDQLRSELIQIAAVAVAIVEDLDYGRAGPLPEHRMRTSDTLAAVFRERVEQQSKFGAQHHDPIVWLAILAEEVGEAARAIDPATLTPATYDGGHILTALLTDAEQIARDMLDDVTRLDGFEAEERRTLPEHDFIGNDNCSRCDAKPWTRSACTPDPDGDNR